VPPASRSPWRPELTPSSAGGRGGARTGAAPTDPPEAAAFEREYPGASWLATRVTRALEDTGARADALVSSVARRHDLSHAALNALAVIEGNGEPLAVGALGAQMHITSGTMTSVIDTLVRNGYVVRSTDPEDRRRVLVDITPAAQAVLDQLLPEVARTVTVALAGLPEQELRELLATLDRVRAAIEAAPTDVGTPLRRRRPARLTRS